MTSWELLAYVLICYLCRLLSIMHTALTCQIRQLFKYELFLTCQKQLLWQLNLTLRMIGKFWSLMQRLQRHLYWARLIFICILFFGFRLKLKGKGIGWDCFIIWPDIPKMVFLNQVGLVHQGMRFPLWLHGRTIVTFLVVSTFPKNLIGTIIE